MSVKYVTIKNTEDDRVFRIGTRYYGHKDEFMFDFTRATGDTDCFNISAGSITNLRDALDAVIKEREEYQRTHIGGNLIRVTRGARTYLFDPDVLSNLSVHKMSAMQLMANADVVIENGKSLKSRY